MKNDISQEGLWVLYFWSQRMMITERLLAASHLKKEWALSSLSKQRNLSDNFTEWKNRIFHCLKAVKNLLTFSKYP